MRIKTLFNNKDKRQKIFRKFIEQTFPEMITEENPEMFFVVGGDGAMLHAHKEYGHTGLPFFGKGMGTANFIMNNFDNDFEIISGLLNGTIVPNIVQTEKIGITLKKKDTKKKIYKESINDIVIGNGIMDYHSLIINSARGAFENFAYRGAGICISTALGSTAYNINNKGNVLPIDLDAWSFTSIVGDRDVHDVMKPQKITITVGSERQTPILFIDGTATALPLSKGDKITLNKKTNKFKIAFIDPKVFFTKRMKLIQEKR
jgi:NAD kinase